MEINPGIVTDTITSLKFLLLEIYQKIVLILITGNFIAKNKSRNRFCVFLV